MSLRKQLEKLRREKAEESHNFHLTYVHTKRDIKRSLSPDRLIRRHLPASLGLAAVAGFLLAPRPAPRSSDRAQEAAPRKAKSLIPQWLRMLIRMFLPQLAAYLPEPKAPANSSAPAAPPPANAAPAEPPPEQKPPAPSQIWRTLLLDLAALALSKIDLHQLLAQLIHNLTGKHPAPDPPAPDPAGPSHEPSPNPVTIE